MKKNKISDKERLEHILTSVNFIIQYTGKLTEDDFLRDEVLKRAIVREFEVLGEAANYISKETQTKYKNVEWAKIISLRNRLIHEYLDVNYRTVWEIVEEEISNLKACIEFILSEL